MKRGISRYRKRVHLSQIQHVFEDYNVISPDVTRHCLRNNLRMGSKSRATKRYIFIWVSSASPSHHTGTVLRGRRVAGTWTIKNRYCHRSNEIYPGTWTLLRHWRRRPKSHLEIIPVTLDGNEISVGHPSSGNALLMEFHPVRKVVRFVSITMIQSWTSMSRYNVHRVRTNEKKKRGGWHFLVFLRKRISLRSAAGPLFGVRRWTRTHIRDRTHSPAHSLARPRPSLTHRVDDIIRKPVCRRDIKEKLCISRYHNGVQRARCVHQPKLKQPHLGYYRRYFV